MPPGFLDAPGGLVGGPGVPVMQDTMMQVLRQQMFLTQSMVDFLLRTAQGAGAVPPQSKEVNALLWTPSGFQRHLCDWKIWSKVPGAPWAWSTVWKWASGDTWAGNSLDDVLASLAVRDRETLLSRLSSLAGSDHAAINSTAELSQLAGGSRLPYDLGGWSALLRPLPQRRQQLVSPSLCRQVVAFWVGVDKVSVTKNEKTVVAEQLWPSPEPCNIRMLSSPLTWEGW